MSELTESGQLMLGGRDDLGEYAVAQYPWYTLARHVRVLIHHLEALMRGDYLKLMVFCPPQHSKTSTCSELFPAWALGKFPWWRTIVVSYGQDRADDFGERIRYLLGTTYHKAIFPECKISPTTKSKNDFELEPIYGHPAGACRAAGRGASITGLPADLIVLDDLEKDEQEARSPVVQAELQSMMNTVIDARCHPDTRLLMIKCLAKGTRIPLDDGRWVPIEAVKAGDRVWSYEDGELASQTVMHAGLSGYDTVYEIRTARFKIAANSRHPFLVIQGERLVFRTVDELSVDDIVVTLRSFPAEHGGEPPTFLGQPITDEFMWLFGFMFGDGWVTKYKKHRKSRSKTGRSRAGTFVSDVYAVCIAKSIYPELDAEVAETAERWFGKAPYDTKFGCIRWDSAAVGRKLQALGLIGKAKEKRIPQWVYGLKADMKRAFLRGLIDADGHKEDRGTLHAFSLGSGNPNLVEDARLLAFECGVRAGGLRIYPAMCKAPHSKELIASLNCSALFNFEDVLGDKKFSFDGHHETVRFERIKSIDFVDEMPVYDLSVEGPANFVAEGFVVHNTRWDPNDIAGWELENHPDGWKVLSMANLGRWIEDMTEEELAELKPQQRHDIRIADENGTALWPERYPTDWVKKNKRDRLLPSQWLALHQQIPNVGGVTKLFEDEWWQTFDAARCTDPDWLRTLRLYIVVDPANAKNKRSDFTVMLVIGLSTDRTWYVLDGVRDRIKQGERCDAYFDLVNKWNPRGRIRCTGWEEYGLQTDIEYMEARKKKEGRHFRIEPLGGKVAKYDRISGLAGMYRDHEIVWADRIPITTGGAPRNLTEDCFELEFKRYPAVAHDDTLDALARMRDMISLTYATFPQPSTKSDDQFFRQRKSMRTGTSWMGR